jgi:hypothetical protein
MLDIFVLLATSHHLSLVGYPAAAQTINLNYECTNARMKMRRGNENPKVVAIDMTSYFRAKILARVPSHF